MLLYELKPTNGQKSFYGKALVSINEDQSKTLYSYGTPIITETKEGTFKKHWQGWTATTGKHIKAFCGMNKKEFLEVE